MKRALLLFGLCLFVAGCGPPRVNVYGASGKAYTAPDLCSALVACQNSVESACYYEREVMTAPDGGHAERDCHEVKRPE